MGDNYIDRYLKMAKESHDNGCWQECIKHSTQILSKDPSNIRAWIFCSISCEKIGLRKKAIAYLEHAISITDRNSKEDIAVLSVNLAELYRKENKALKAVNLLTSLLPIDNADLHFNLARCYTELDDYEKSIEHYIAAIRIDPNDLGALFNLANQKLAIGSMMDALKYYSLAYEGGYTDAGINLAHIYVSLDRLQEAGLIYAELEEFYKDDAFFCFNYANFHRYNLDEDSAYKYYSKAIKKEKDSRFYTNFSHFLLSTGNLYNGFTNYEMRLSASEHMPKHYSNILKLDFENTPSDQDILRELRGKKILIYHDQGFGDTIMFARFVSLLEGERITLLVPQELVKMLRALFKDKARITNAIPDIGSYDISVPFTSLGFLFKTKETVDSALTLFRERFSRLPRYSIDKDCKSNFLRKCDCGWFPFTKESNTTFRKKRMFKVGLNFCSTSGFQYSKEKSVCKEALLKALPRDNYCYFSLQYEGIDEYLQYTYNVFDLKENIKSFYESAIYVLQLDCMITIDSALAHLSASAGKPTILLLHKRYDWRWGKLGSLKSSPVKSCIFYDDYLIMLAQENFGDWDEVLLALPVALKMAQELCGQLDATSIDEEYSLYPAGVGRESNHMR